MQLLKPRFTKGKLTNQGLRWFTMKPISISEIKVTGEQRNASAFEQKVIISPDWPVLFFSGL